MKYARIVEELPHKPPFKFVDEITFLNENLIKGYYKLPQNAFFFKGHFPDNPITPGVIVLEIMAQIGLVAFGKFLVAEKAYSYTDIFFTSSEVKYSNPSYPGDRITVVSEKIYFKFRKLKCKVTALKDNGDIVCYGTLSGMLH